MDHFVSLLRAHAVSQIVDVRSFPVSKWAPHFSKDALEPALARHHIKYLFLGRELGGHPANNPYAREDGSVDYDRQAEAPNFQKGLRQLISLGVERPTAFMCAEEAPTGCHRHRLIAHALRRCSVSVMHVRGDGRLEDAHQEPAASKQLLLF